MGPLCYSNLPNPVVCKWKYLCLSVCVNCTCMSMTACMHTLADNPSLSCTHTGTHMCPCIWPLVTCEGIKPQQGSVADNLSSVPNTHMCVCTHTHTVVVILSSTSVTSSTGLQMFPETNVYGNWSFTLLSEFYCPIHNVPHGSFSVKSLFCDGMLSENTFETSLSQS